MTERYSKLRSEDIALSFLNLFGLLVTSIFVSYVILRVNDPDALQLYIWDNIKGAIILCLIYVGLYLCRLNRRIVYRFSDQMFVAVVPIVIASVLYVLGKKTSTSIYICGAVVASLQGLYYKLKCRYIARTSDASQPPVFSDVVWVASKIWPVVLISLSTILCVLIIWIELELLIEIITSNKSLPPEGILLSGLFASLISITMICYYSFIWLMSVILYAFDFNRPFFDDKLSQIIWSTLFATSFFIYIECNTPGGYYYVMFIAPMTFYLAQGMYRLYKVKKAK